MCIVWTDEILLNNKKKGTQSKYIFCVSIQFIPFVAFSLFFLYIYTIFIQNTLLKDNKFMINAKMT